MIQRVAPQAIRVGERHRKDMGDIDRLARSITERGLLHFPIVTKDLLLVVGHRRLEAVKRLGWSHVDVRVVDIGPEGLVLAERDENNERLDFNPSEQVAIARTIVDLAEERRGRPTKEPAPNEEKVDHDPLFPPGEKTREVAAKQAGFDSDFSFRKAATVVDKGVPELVEAMDSGEVSISAAAVVAELPKPEQAEVVARGPAAVKEKAKEVRESKAAKPSNGIPAPPPPLLPPEPPPVISGPPGFAKLWQDISDFLISLPRRGEIDGLLKGYPREVISGTYGEFLALREAVERSLSRLEGAYPWLKSQADD